uniref:SH3 domain-containing protein n=1 Tax=Globodera pallida TaxID=36090 RepID=A0A183C4D3_GLOPA
MELARKNTAYQSQVKYHEAYEKQMKGTKLEVADDPETKRHKANMMNQSLAHYHGELQKKEKQDTQRETAGSTPSAFSTGFAVCNSSSLDSLSSAMSNASSVVRTPPHNGSAYRHQQPPDSNYRNSSQQQHNNQQQHQAYSYGQLFADKDSSPYSQRIAQQAHGTVIYSSDWGGKVDAGAEKPVGSIADYDPMAAEKQQKGGTAAGGAAVKMGAAKANGGGFTVKALYDYTAADKDEVSFKEGDVIVNCQKVDDGWMTGTVQRTLLWGMLPANYVEQVKQPMGQFKLK